MKARTRYDSAFFTFLLLLLSGCATSPAIECTTGEKTAINDLLYFGTAKPKGIVSLEEWQNFLNKSVTPRFPKGFTFWTAAGQWQGNNSIIVQEKTFVLNLIHPDNRINDTAVDAILRDYQLRFAQEEVLRVQSPVCTSLKGFRLSN